MSFDYDPTTRVVFGENSLSQIGELSRDLGGKRVLLVTDKGLVSAGHVASALDQLRKASLQTCVFDGVEENPTTRHVQVGVQTALGFAPDIIVGLGGGSALDCAKGINFLLTNGGSMADYRGFGKAKDPMLPAIGIPTTAGTGSEAQSFALIADDETHEKMACGDLKARFRIAVLDPLLLVSAPQSVKAISGMDAISHAVESYVSTKRNAVSTMFAKEAFRLLMANYQRFLHEPQNVGVAGDMLWGAHLAGAAIENAMLGAAHACANPLTAHFGITHGMAVAIMLPHVVAFNAPVADDAYAMLLEQLPENISPSGSAANRLAQCLTELNNGKQWPDRLRNLSVAESDLPRLAQEAAAQWTAQFNPRPVAEQDLLKIYQQAY